MDSCKTILHLATVLHTGNRHHQCYYIQHFVQWLNKRLPYGDLALICNKVSFYSIHSLPAQDISSSVIKFAPGFDPV